MPTASRAAPESFALTLAEAERLALQSSNELKAYASTVESANQQAKAQFAALFPRLTFDASYRYISTIPNVQFPFPGVSPIQFAHSNYSIGPTLAYALWDTGGSKNAYHSLLKLSDSREQDRKTAERQLLLSVRSAYIRVQLALEELRLVDHSLEVARTQNHDISVNFRAGAASRLDLVDSRRAVLSYELQLEQSQTNLSSTLEDLFALTHPDDTDHQKRDLSQIEVKLDPLPQSVTRASTTFTPPGDSHPRERSALFLAESSELAAQSERARLYPGIQLSFRTSIDYPNGIVLERIYQNTVSVGLSMPLFEMNQTKHLAQQKRVEADANRYRKDQIKTDLSRDYSKGVRTLKSLQAQRNLAVQDVEQSAELARLFYTSYRGGKSTLTDVLSANVRALQSKVVAARIDAQILDQVAVLQAVSGEEQNNVR